MQIPILIEQVTNNGFRAATGQPLGLTVEGATRGDALEQMRKAIEDRLQNGAEIAPLEVPAPAHPLAPFAGMFKDNPLFDAWQAAITDYREDDGEREGS